MTPLNAFVLELRHEIATEREAREKAEQALEKINAIRNSIIGFQKINWSEHIFPLVAVLNEAGLPAMPYEEARESHGTMLERTLRAEKENEVLRARIAQMDKAIDEINVGVNAGNAVIWIESISGFYMSVREAIDVAIKEQDKGDKT